MARRKAWLAALLCAACAARGEAPQRIALTARTDGPAPAGWYLLPDLLAHRTPPDVLLRLWSNTWQEAAENLLLAAEGGGLPLAEAADGTRWLRLDGIDLCTVAECETCLAAPPDPHQVLELADLPASTADQLAFYTAVGQRAEGHRWLRLYAVGLEPPRAPAGVRGMPGPPIAPVDPHRPPGPPLAPAGLVPAGPIGARAPLPAPPKFLSTGLWAYGGDEFRSQRRTDELDLGVTYELRALPEGEFLGLPGRASLLVDDLTPADSVAVRAHPRDLATIPDAWFHDRLDAVEAGARTALGNRYRVDDPLLARALDVCVPLREQLDQPPYQLAAGLVDLVGAVDQGRPLSDSAASRLRHARHPDLIRRIGSLRRVAELTPGSYALPGAPAASIDGMLAPGEWATACRLRLALRDDGTPADRTAEVWLALRGNELWFAVSATEPDPEAASMADRLLIRVSTGDLAMVTEHAFTVGGEATALERDSMTGAAAEAPVTGRHAALFDGPGWTMEGRLRLPAGDAWRVQLITEHRARYDRDATVLQPTAGAGWWPPRYATLHR